MRKKTAPRTQRHQNASSHQRAGLIAKGEGASPSAAEGSALANRSHRTHIGLLVVCSIALFPCNLRRQRRYASGFVTPCIPPQYVQVLHPTRREKTAKAAA